MKNSLWVFSAAIILSSVFTAAGLAYTTGYPIGEITTEDLMREYPYEQKDAFLQVLQTLLDEYAAEIAPEAEPEVRDLLEQARNQYKRVLTATRINWETAMNDAQETFLRLNRRLYR